MTAPVYLTSSHRFLRLQGISDVQDIIDAFYDEAVNQNDPPWTDVGAGALRSPIDVDGRFMDVLLEGILVNKLQMTLNDQFADTVCVRRIIGASPGNWDVRIFTGQYHFCIDVCNNPVSWEEVHGGILDLSPMSQGAHETYVYGNGSRTSGDVLDANDSSVTALWMRDGASTATLLLRVGNVKGLASSDSAVVTLGGNKTIYPREVWACGRGQYYSAAYPIHFAGRCYQTVLVDSKIGPGVEFYNSIDVGVPVRFMTIGGIKDDFGRRVAMRAD
jgi:hypothetical protein